VSEDAVPPAATISQNVTDDNDRDPALGRLAAGCAECPLDGHLATP
jgi:hypothetical protein